MDSKIQSIKAISISGTPTPYSKNKEKVSITDLAPTWFREGVNERMNKGVTRESAIAQMKASPFFNEKWIA